MTETILLHDRGRHTQEESKTVRALSFEVPPGVETLSLKFDYGPRFCDDVAVNRPLVEAAFERYLSTRRGHVDQAELDRVRAALHVEERAKRLHNLMNVTLVDPTGRWRGRWDRNPSSASGELVLSRELASRGFMPGELPAGTWTAAVECHGVFGAPVDWEIAVRARGPLTAEESDEIRRPVGAPLVTRALPPRRSGPGWYFGEMHSHTVHSDGKWELRDLAARVAETGADFLALTDHNTTSGLLAPEALPLSILPGIELTTFHGHHPVYGVRETVPWHVGGRVRALAETGPEARRAGAIVGVAHPFVPGDPLCTGCRMRDDLAPGSFDTMEVWYRRWTSPGADNAAAYRLWNELWAEGHPVTAVGARDWHGPDQDGPFPGGMPFTAIWAEDNTPEALFAGLRAGRVIVSNGPTLDVALTSKAGERAVVGGALSAREAPVLSVTIERLSADPLGADAELRVYRRGERLATRAVKGDGTIAIGAVDAPGWYRAELWQGEEPRAITNHVVWAAT